MKIILEAASSDSQVGSGDAIVSGNAQALKRSGSKDDKRINGEQASNKLQARRVTSSKKDIRRLQQSSHFLKQENVYDADSEDEDANDEEATLKAEEPSLIPEQTVSKKATDDEATLLFDRPPFDPYNISSLPDSHFVSIYPGASLPSVSETTPLMQVHMAPPYTFFTPPHLVYAQSHPSSSASSLTATPFGFRVGDAPSYFTPFHGGYIPTGFADYRSAYESYQGDNESEEEDDSEPAAKVRPDAATAVKPIVVERDGRTPIAATISQDSVDFHVCTTPDGALIICHQDGSRTLINSDSTDVAALFCDGKIKVRSLLTSGGGTEVTKILNNPGLENVAVSEHRRYARWTEEEDDTLREAIDKYGPPPYDWNRISRKYFKGLRSSLQCKNRWKKCLQPELKRTPFSKEEDAIITAGMEANKSWCDIATLLPGRIAEQVRERWINVLDPDLKKGPWTDEENEILFRAQAEMGNQWVKIARLLPGRSENAVKNRWHNAKMSQRRMMKRLATQADIAAKLKVARSHNIDTDE